MRFLQHAGQKAPAPHDTAQYWGGMRGARVGARACAYAGARVRVLARMQVHSAAY
jgi:hypothetical protein